MTATEELRRLLDERGAEWMPTAWNPQRETFYRTANGVGICADEYTDGVRIHTDATITPEQAIAATLGAWMCHKLPSSGDTVCIVRRHGFDMEFGYWRCSECGCECFEGARYCMNCGRKVK